jgi:adenylosuccinate lyase
VHLPAADLDRLFAPEHYLGAAEEFVDRVLSTTK